MQEEKNEIQEANERLIRSLEEIYQKTDTERFGLQIIHGANKEVEIMKEMCNKLESMIRLIAPPEWYFTSLRRAEDFEAITQKYMINQYKANHQLTEYDIEALDKYMAQVKELEAAQSK